MLQVENTLFTTVMISYFASMVLFFIYIAAKKEIFSKIAFALQTFGFVLHTVAIVCRGIPTSSPTTCLPKPPTYPSSP